MSNIKVDKFDGKMNCEVEMPGSKSYTNRVLIITALAKGKSKILSPLHSDDTKYMIESLRNLGINIIVEKNGDIIVEGNGGEFKDIKKREIFAGIAGTTSRFLTAFSVLVGGDIFLDGEGKILERPIGQLVDGLMQIGAEIQYKGKDGSLPLVINGDNVLGGEVKMNGEVSSQFFTALMLIAPKLKNDLKISVIGKQISKSYIDITIDLMKEFGVEVINDNYQEYTIKKNQKYIAREYKVEGDWSSASYFCALGVMHEGSVTIKNLNNNSSQGDRNFPKILEKMGAKIEHLSDGIKVSREGVLNGVEIDMEQMPDTAMTVAVIATQAKGKTVITGLSTLKAKETDRIEAMKNELAKLNIKTETSDSSITIYPRELVVNGMIKTYHDHRIAMVFAILATKIGNVVIENKKVVNKSFPEFWKMLQNIGIKTFEIPKKIILIGFRTVGKTTISRLLAKKINYECIDLDEVINKRTQKTVAEITRNGANWSEFRKIEHSVLEDALKLDNVVISAGGGVGVNDILIDDLNKTYGQLNSESIKNTKDLKVIWVDAKEEKILERIKEVEDNSLDSRPVLGEIEDNDVEFEDKKTQKEYKINSLIKDSQVMYKKRGKFYKELSDFRIDTTFDNVDESVEKILNEI